MKYHLRMRPRWLPYFSVIFLLIGLLVPVTIAPAAQTIELVVENPLLFPTYSDCPNSYWDTFLNDRGHTTYLTLNVADPDASTNRGEWHPTIPQDGYYLVEAYIAGHDPIKWCGTGSLKEHDTTDAHYSIHHADGTSTRMLSQYPLNNQWLSLGIYYFQAGTSGYVSLSDLNDEPAYSTTVSFSAMRFTFTSATRLKTYLPVVGHADTYANPVPDVGVIQGQGFDVCSLPSVSTMQTWWNQSPYTFYGLYLGGIQLPAQCARADAAWVHAVHQQGWSFIPTWVGPQPPCSPLSKKMSPDPSVSYQQGRQEAESASNQAAIVGLTTSGLGGTIIYYDMEVFGGASLECRQAASAFMNGWSERLHELGNKAGGYGAHNSYVEDWATIAHGPNDVWAASWYADTYDPYASVNTIPWLQGLWVNHQRIRQYAGQHHESWGGIGISIDSDVADGEVAMPPFGPLVEPSVTSSPSIEDSGWLSADQGWLVSQARLYWTSDRGKSWVDISPAPVDLAYFMPSGQAWALSNSGEGHSTIYYSLDRGVSWEKNELSLPLDDSRPIQLQFSSPTSGWLVLQKATSLPFDLATLLKTSNAGLTWQTVDLPIVGKITFIDQSEGWLINIKGDQVFQTTDGGLTWQVARQIDFPSHDSTLPAGTTLSGWLADGLGWAATSNGSCQGIKLTSDFTCQVDNRLWQSQDGGETWDAVPLPESPQITQ